METVDIIWKSDLSQSVLPDTYYETSGACGEQTKYTAPFKAWCPRGSAFHFAANCERWVARGTKNKICSQMIWVQVSPLLLPDIWLVASGEIHLGDVITSSLQSGPDNLISAINTPEAIKSHTHLHCCCHHSVLHAILAPDLVGIHWVRERSFGREPETLLGSSENLSPALQMAQ